MFLYEHHFGTTNVNITYMNNVDKTELVRQLQKEKLTTVSKIKTAC